MIPMCFCVGDDASGGEDVTTLESAGLHPATASTAAISSMLDVRRTVDMASPLRGSLVVDEPRVVSHARVVRN